MGMYASIAHVLVCVCTLHLCVILCLVLLAFDGQLHSIARKIHSLCTWFLEEKEEALYNDEKLSDSLTVLKLSNFTEAALMEN